MVYQAEPSRRLAVHCAHIPQAERSKGPILVFPDSSGFFAYFLFREKKVCRRPRKGPHPTEWEKKIK